jgi:hypothetical protein
MGGSVKREGGCWNFLVIENGMNVLGVGRKAGQVDPAVVEIQNE